MILVDDRAGSSDMAPILQRLGLDVKLTRMPYGDIAWTGWGVNGDPLLVGVEMKTLNDVLACIETGRFAGHQLPGLIQSYNCVWLLVQGVWRARGSDGLLEVYKRGRGGGFFWTEAGGGGRHWMWRDLEAWLDSMAVLGGIRIHRVPDWDEGALWIKTLYSWFQKTEHHSHLVMYSGPGLRSGPGAGNVAAVLEHRLELRHDRALLSRPSLIRRLAAELPRIGVKKSEAVEAHFSSVREMITAGEGDWAEIEGIGRGIAKEVVKAINHSTRKG